MKRDVYTFINDVKDHLGQYEVRYTREGYILNNADERYLKVLRPRAIFYVFDPYDLRYKIAKGERKDCFR